MLRYFAIATAIVLVAIVALVAIPAGRVREPQSQHYTTARGTPGPPERDASQRRPSPVTGAAPWALSALPECFQQHSQAGGPPAFARARIPAGARLIGGGTLRVEDCTLEVRRDSAIVTRGENRLAIPPRARLYVAGLRLILDRLERGREDVRTYTLAGGARPSFAPAGDSTKPPGPRR